MTDIRQLASQLHEIAWSAVREGPAADPWAGAGGTRQERRAGALQLLAVYSQLIKVLQRRIDLTIKDALDAGSDYGEIATACGVSRQAIRQRWLRRSTSSLWYEVWRRPRPAARPTVGRAANFRRPSGCGWPAGRMMAAVIWLPQARCWSTRPMARPLIRPALYRSWRGISPAGTMRMSTSLPESSGITWRPGRRGHDRGSTGGAKPRVYELAAEFGVESKVVMAKLQEMGEFVRSASSTVEHAAAEELREQFAARARHKPRSSG